MLLSCTIVTFQLLKLITFMRTQDLIMKNYTYKHKYARVF